MSGTPFTRRDFIQGALATIMLGGILDSCGSPPDKSAKTVLRLERLLASIEVSALAAYEAVANGLQSGRLGKAPSVATDLVSTAQAHHRAHLDHWNEALVKVHQAPQTAPNPPIALQVRQGLIKIETLSEALNLLLLVEDTSAQTCASSIGIVPDTTVRRWCALIAPVEAQHAALLRMLLGQDIAPTSVLPTDLVRPLSDISN